MKHNFWEQLYTLEVTVYTVHSVQCTMYIVSVKTDVVISSYNPIYNSCIRHEIFVH